MRIQRQNKHGSWNVLAEGTIRRISSGWGEYTFELTNDRNENKTIYRVTLDSDEIDKIKKGPLS